MLNLGNRFEGFITDKRFVKKLASEGQKSEVQTVPGIEE
jgi:hypothetical protein